MHKFNQKGATILVVVVFMMIFLSILTAYVLKTYYKSQQTEYDIDKIEHHYNLETNLQRAVSLVKSEGRKDLSDTNSFNQNWLGTYGTDFIIEVKEFNNWDGYVINNNEALNEVNGTSDSITWSNPVSIKIISQVFDKELEYLIRRSSGNSFTIYSNNTIGIDYDGNYHPYLPTNPNYSADLNTNYFANDTRIENSEIYYANNVYCSTDAAQTPSWNGKLDSDTVLEQKTIPIPSFFTLSGNQGYQDLTDPIADGPGVNRIDYNGNSIDYFGIINRVVSGVTNVFLIKRNSFTIDIDRNLYTQELMYDIIFICRGDVILRRNFWVDKSARFGIISFGNMNIEPLDYTDLIGGNIFLYAQENIEFLADNDTGTNTIVGKILAGNDIILDGTDYYQDGWGASEQTSGDPFDYNTTDNDLKLLWGLNITDKPNIFTSPRNLPFDIEYGGGGGGGPQAEIWREN